MNRRNLSLGLLVALATGPSSLAAQRGVELALRTGFNDNVTNVEEPSLRKGSVFCRSALDFSLDWASEESLGAPFFKAGLDNDFYPDSGIAGNVSVTLVPGYRFYLLEKKLSTTFQYRFSDGAKYTLATRALVSGRKNSESILRATSESEFTAEPYAGHDLNWRSEYSWSEARASFGLTLQRRRYTETARTDTSVLVDLGAGTSAWSAADLSFAAGLEDTRSDLAGYPYHGPYGYVMAALPVGDALSLTLLARTAFRTYTMDEEDGDRLDTYWNFDATLDYELSAQTTLNFGISKTVNSSDYEGYSYSSLESSVGFVFTY